VNQTLRRVHAWLAWVFVGAILVQVWLAGAAIPQLGGNGSFEVHRNFGYAIGLLSLVQVLLAAAARMGRTRILQSLGLFVLYIIQSSLPYMDPDLPAAAALHPVNAVVMFGLGFWYARQVWRERVGVAA
jgi:hypothetical protein